MNRKFIRGSLTGGLLVALSLTLPADTVAQRSGVEIWAVSCGRCHIIQPTNKYDAAGWVSVGQHMAITARLTSAETDAVIAFLISGARTVGMEEAPEAGSVRPALTHIATTQGDEVKTLYESVCAPCHGVEGKGDGIAAVALNPKPRDFTSQEFKEQFSVDELLTAVTDGKGAMPSFRATLSLDQMRSLIEYVQQFSNAGTASALTDGAR